MPSLVSAYIASLKIQVQPAIKSGQVTIRYAICRLLYTFCKVRGEKVVAGFLNNEPRYLEPLLSAFESGTSGTKALDESGSVSESTSLSWEERYILLLWLSHQMLAPFDLASISSFTPDPKRHKALNLDLPPDLPGISIRILVISMKHLESTTRERNAAAQLLVRLCLRPDSVRTTLPSALCTWFLAHFNDLAREHGSIHKSLGVLMFFSKLVASGNNEEVGRYTPAVYRICQTIMTSDSSSFLRSSAVTRKLTVKMVRSIVLISLSPGFVAMDAGAVLEEVIGYLLEALGDGDSSVRFAASKALSVIAMQLDSAMAAEVAEAILGALNEDVIWTNAHQSLDTVDAARWHGLVLTLGHLLFRRTVAPKQLPEVLDALLLALTFEQKSSTGNSIGSNVRDAANFGIWALSRRYTVKELQAVDTHALRTSQHNQSSTSVAQILALELVCSACLDPMGNIRRGSSAALQELIGRHPDMVSQGIPLVQAVDFQAVGLRRRGMAQVASAASQLDQIYWGVLFSALLEWRGLGAVDSQSRQFAATAINSFALSQPLGQALAMLDDIQKHLRSLSKRQVEERHGMMLALASLLAAIREKLLEVDNFRKINAQLEATTKLNALWSLWSGALRLTQDDFASAALRPELTAIAVCQLTEALCSVMSCLRKRDNSFKPDGPAEAVRLLGLCLSRRDDSVIECMPKTVRAIANFVGPVETGKLATEWLVLLKPGSTIGGRKSGYPIALASLFSAPGLSPQQRTELIETLTSRCRIVNDIDTRILSLRSLCIILPHLHDESLSKEIFTHKVAQALALTLDDYTINERGDVGSLVRLEALEVVEAAWKLGLLRHGHSFEETRAAVIRLSLEKLDKVRSRAARCLSWAGDVKFLRSVTARCWSIFLAAYTSQYRG